MVNQELVNRPVHFYQKAALAVCPLQFIADIEGLYSLFSLFITKNDQKLKFLRMLDNAFLNIWFSNHKLFFEILSYLFILGSFEIIFIFIIFCDISDPILDSVEIFIFNDKGAALVHPFLKFWSASKFWLEVLICEKILIRN